MHNDFSKIVDIEIRFPIKMSIAVFILAVLFDLSFYLVTTSWKETLIFSAATMAAAGTVLAAFYSARILSLQLCQEVRLTDERMESLHLKRLANAMVFGSRWTDSQMKISRKTCRDISNMKGHSLERIVNVLDTEEKKETV